MAGVKEVRAGDPPSYSGEVGFAVVASNLVW